MSKEELALSVSIHIGHSLYSIAPNMERLGHEVFDAVYNALTPEHEPVLTLNSCFMDMETFGNPLLTCTYVLEVSMSAEPEASGFGRLRICNRIEAELLKIEGIALRPRADFSSHNFALLGRRIRRLEGTLENSLQAAC